MTKITNNSSTHLDEIDYAILQTLQKDASISNVRLAEVVGLSPAATLARVKKLEHDDVIQGYIARLDKEKLGFNLFCFVHVILESHDVQLVDGFRMAITSMPEVIECHFVTGHYDYLLKVVVKNREELEEFLVHTVAAAPGVKRLQTSLVLREVKPHSALPLDVES